jgi:hypothetical protein
MSKGNRIEKLRITRNGTGRHYSLAGGVVIGDYIDPTNGELVLTVERPATATSTSKPKMPKKPKGKASPEDTHPASV